MDFRLLHQLKGHSDEVLSLACPVSLQNPLHCLLSGSADGTARLWDARERNYSAVHCFSVPDKEEVNAVQFSANQDADHRIFVTAGSCLYCYDLRKPGVDRKVLLRGDDYLCKFLVHKDDINQISISPTGSYLSVVDDAGLNTIYSIQRLDQLLSNPEEKISMKPVSQIRHSPQDDIICYTSEFMSERQIITGGMDCTIAKWNYSKKQEIYRINFSDEQQKQVFNPKFVYSIDHVDDIVAAGTGNGTVFLVENNTGIISSILEDIHGTAVNQVRFGKIDNENYLFTSGNDSRITMWNIPSTKKKKQAPPPPKNSKKGKKQKGRGKQKTKNTTNVPNTTSTPQEESCPREPVMVKEIRHHSKINWMSIGNESLAIGKLPIFIADQTNQISLYSIE